MKQIAQPESAELRDALGAMVERLAPPFQGRARELLSSLENRRFFQGFAEAVSLSILQRAGYELQRLEGAGPRLELRRGDESPITLGVLSFLHQTRPVGDLATRQRLEQALGRAISKHRFVVLIRRWLPHDLDPEPVRRALEGWLGQVSSGAWEGRYAAYEDDKMSLEFCLTGEKVKGRQSPLALVIGPFMAHRAMEVLEPRVVRELDRHNAGAARHQPLVLVCASDQPWQINAGYLRDFLYGRPSLIASENGEVRTHFGASDGPSAFRDPLYANLAAVVMLDRSSERPLEVNARAFVNPWSRLRLRGEDLGIRTFAPESAAAPPTLRWYVAPSEALTIG